MEKIKNSIGEVPESPHVTATVVARPEHIALLIKNAVAQEFACHVSNAGGNNMSDSDVSKDWIERKTSELAHSIAMEKVKNDAKFEKLISQSDIKFEKLIGDMNAKFATSEAKIAQSESTHTKWMIGIAFTLIALTLTAITFSTNLILRAIPSISSQSAPALPSDVITKKPSPIINPNNTHQARP